MVIEVKFEELFRLIQSTKDYDFLKQKIERETVIKELDIKDTVTPKLICERLKTYPFSRVSRALSALMERKLCRCINGADKANRRYLLTKRGYRIRKCLEKEEEDESETIA